MDFTLSHVSAVALDVSDHFGLPGASCGNTVVLRPKTTAATTLCLYFQLLGDLCKCMLQ